MAGSTPQRNGSSMRSRIALAADARDGLRDAMLVKNSA
jgi:hypothetical protein